PLVYFGLFTAGQYLIWRTWANRPRGHLAALVTVLSAPMPALWSIVPRGGYVEVLAWALPVLGASRYLTRANAPPLGRVARFGWGLLLAFGSFLNPLSLIVYATLAIDWSIGRHGAEIATARPHLFGWVQFRWSPLGWSALAAATILTAGACCNVRF